MAWYQLKASIKNKGGIIFFSAVNRLTHFHRVSLSLLAGFLGGILMQYLFLVSWHSLHPNLSQNRHETKVSCFFRRFTLRRYRHTQYIWDLRRFEKLIPDVSDCTPSSDQLKHCLFCTGRRIIRQRSIIRLDEISFRNESSTKQPLSSTFHSHDTHSLLGHGHPWMS